MLILPSVALLLPPQSEILVPSVRIERTTYRLPYHFDFRRHHVRGLDYPLAIARVRAAGSPRLVSTPSRGSGLGSGSAWPEWALAFPEFEGFYSRRFRRGTRSDSRRLLYP